MDKPIKKSNNHRRWYAVVAVVLAIGSIAWLASASRSFTLSIPKSDIQVEQVVSGQFFYYISLNASVQPNRSQLLDSKATGTVDMIFVEDGETVNKGDTLLKLSNPELELEVMQREGQLIEQLNAQRQTMLLINQNDFALREQLVEVDYQIELEGKRFDRAEQMLTENLIAVADYEPTAAQYDYYKARRNMLNSAYQQDSLARIRQLAQIRITEERLLNNLEAVGQLLNRLYVLAPIDGRLSNFEAIVGQSIANGDRLGEIYRLDAPLLEAEVDEYYLDMIELGQGGRALLRGDSLSVQVYKIFPSVEGGRFRVQLRIEPPEVERLSLVKGQSVRILLYFGRVAESLLIPEGDFYNSTGGDWVFVLKDDIARRVDIDLGRRNPDFYEVISGLHEGDQVIVSDYRNWIDYSTIQIQP
ncbi:MAG: efflux RND transporter periplasmic adaptor subunit [Bacteroidota bacterium]